MLVRHAADTGLPALLRLYRQLNQLAVAPIHPEGAWAATRAHSGVTVNVAEENWRGRRHLYADRDPEPPYDVIVVHAFSRFYRDGAVMELTIRELRRHGVEVISTTQPTGTDPSQEMMRQIIGIFDEYTSNENRKNVTVPCWKTSNRISGTAQRRRSNTR